MKPLATTFRKDGFDWSLVERQGDIAIYRQAKPGVERFNTFHVQSHNGREIGGKVFEPAEFMPSAEQWGRLGWTHYTLEKAQEKMAEELEALASRKEGK